MVALLCDAVAARRYCLFWYVPSSVETKGQVERENEAERVIRPLLLARLRKRISANENKRVRRWPREELVNS